MKFSLVSFEEALIKFKRVLGMREIVYIGSSEDIAWSRKAKIADSVFAQSTT